MTNCTNDTRGVCHHKNHKHPHGLCSVVVDDANNVAYIYGRPGDVVHENYHVPGSDCLSFASVQMPTSEAVVGVQEADEFFVGEHPGDKIALSHTPQANTRMLVFLNGLKQREGDTYDFSSATSELTFHSALLATDTVEVMYTYEVS